MLKRKLVRAAVFSNGLLLMIATVNGTNHQLPVDSFSRRIETTDPSLRRLLAFDSSFAEISEFSETILANAPELPLNSRAAKFVKDYNSKNKCWLQEIADNEVAHLAIIDSIFTLNHLPIELKYLAVVESKLKSKAVSKVGAVGAWQFMASTARLCSLKVTRKYDERTNFVKSTKAAARYLKDLYSQFGDWLLVIAAYNCGPGNVRLAIKKSGSHSFWAMQNFLPAETRGHVKRFIATHYFFEDHGSITTLTKAEVLNYKKSLTGFIAKAKDDYQKQQLPKAEFTTLTEAIVENK